MLFSTISNRVKSGIVLIEIVLTGDPLYLLSKVWNVHVSSSGKRWLDNITILAHFFKLQLGQSPVADPLIVAQDLWSKYVQWQQVSLAMLFTAWLSSEFDDFKFFTLLLWWKGNHKNQLIFPCCLHCVVYSMLQLAQVFTKRLNFLVYDLNFSLVYCPV